MRISERADKWLRVTAVCLGIALCAVVGSQAQIGPAPGGGGGTPCTTTASSVQYNNAGAFGCTSGLTATSLGKLSFNTTTIGTGSTNPVIALSGANTISMAGSDQTGDGLLISARLMMGGGVAASAQSQSAIAWTANNSLDNITVDSGVGRTAAGVVEINNGTNVPQNGGAYRELILRSVVSGGTVPGISGCSADTQTGGATAGTFTSRTGGACTVTLTFAYSAPAGWNCAVNNRTTANAIRQSSSSVTTAVITGITVSGDVISYSCMAY